MSGTVRILDSAPTLEEMNTVTLTPYHPLFLESAPVWGSPRTRFRATKHIVSNKLRKSKRKAAKLSRRKNRRK